MTLPAAALGELRALMEAATPGPYSVETVPTSVGICHKLMPFTGCIYVDDSKGGRNRKELLATATFIAAACNAVPGLLAAVESLDRELGDNAAKSIDAIKEMLGRIEALTEQLATMTALRDDWHAVADRRSAEIIRLEQQRAESEGESLESLFTEPAASVEIHRWPDRKSGPAYIILFTDPRGLAHNGQGATLREAIAAANAARLRASSKAAP